MPPILPVDPVWQYAVTIGLTLLGMFLQKKNVNLPILSWLIDILTRTPQPPAVSPTAETPVRMRAALDGLHGLPDVLKELRELIQKLKS